MYRVDAILKWWIHCSGPDFTRIIYAVSKFHGVIRTCSCVRRVCMCREACRLARISCHVRRVPKWCLKGTGKFSIQRIPSLCWSVTRFRPSTHAVQGRPHWLQPLTSPESRLKSAFWITHAYCSSFFPSSFFFSKPSAVLDQQIT